MNKLIDELATVALAQFDAETRLLGGDLVVSQCLADHVVTDGNSTTARKRQHTPGTITGE